MSPFLLDYHFFLAWPLKNSLTLDLYSFSFPLACLKPLFFSVISSSRACVVSLIASLTSSSEQGVISPRQPSGLKPSHSVSWKSSRDKTLKPDSLTSVTTPTADQERSGRSASQRINKPFIISSFLSNYFASFILNSRLIYHIFSDLSTYHSGRFLLE